MPRKALHDVLIRLEDNRLLSKYWIHSVGKLVEIADSDRERVLAAVKKFCNGRQFDPNTHGGLAHTLLKIEYDAFVAKTTDGSSAGSSQAPFNFMKLPPEIRNKIYRILLRVDFDIRPDINGPLAAYSGYSGSPECYPRTINHCELLRVSRQVHSEASTVLYRENTFAFSDTDYREDWVDEVWDGASHDCDLGNLYTFLCLIGPSNRQKLRTLKFTMMHIGFAYSIGGIYPDSDRPGEHRVPLGQVLANSFELLSKGHNLRTIEINCWQISEYYAYEHFFRMRNSNVLRNLRKIKGIQKLICEEDEEYPGPCEIIRELKAEMNDPSDLSRDEKTKEPKPRATLSERLVKLERERKELTASIRAIGQKLERTDEELTEVTAEFESISTRMREMRSGRAGMFVSLWKAFPPLCSYSGIVAKLHLGSDNSTYLAIKAPARLLFLAVCRENFTAPVEQFS
ncbi:MAG: hypothetical protein M1812_004740 [Candelaria pacifica]|nr:MAG: hypothetical protein M1812_004740 [Candelaria pacifica]